MVREWISAHEASELIERAMERAEAVRVICTYATEGLATARAKKLVIGPETTNDAEIPAKFWRALIDDALTQDWASGTFRSHIGSEYHPEGATFCRAFGVEFRRREITAILPSNLLGDETPVAAAPTRSAKEPRVSERWHEWVAELARYIHEEGIPPGVGTQHQGEIIKAIEEALAKREIETLSRQTVQPVVNAVLHRIRGAEN